MTRRGRYDADRPKVGPVPHHEPDTGPPSRVVHTPGPEGGMSLSHWCPADALGWCCVICQRAFVRADTDHPWQ